MPSGAGEQRAEEVAALEGVLHRRRTNSRIGDWLEAVRPADDVQSRQVELIRRNYERNLRVPEAISAALARTGSISRRVWAEARRSDDFGLFAPKFGEVVALVREKAAALADGGNLYDALLDGFEPEMTEVELDKMFFRRTASAPRELARSHHGVGAEGSGTRSRIRRIRPAPAFGRAGGCVRL